MITFKRLPDIPFCFNLKRRPSCQTNIRWVTKLKDRIVQINDIVFKRIKAKFIFSSIASHDNKKELNVKPRLVIGLAASKLPDTENIIICHSKILFTRGVYEPQRQG